MCPQAKVGIMRVDVSGHHCVSANVRKFPPQRDRRAIDLRRRSPRNGGAE
jgi:hypothetical protein